MTRSFSSSPFRVFVHRRIFPDFLRPKNIYFFEYFRKENYSEAQFLEKGQMMKNNKVFLQKKEWEGERTTRSLETLWRNVLNGLEIDG